MKKALSVVEYTFLISLFIVAILAMQVYLARSVQGSFQKASDEMADQYGYGVSDVDEHEHAQSRTLEITIPGWGAPRTFICSRGSTSSDFHRGVASLEEIWP